MDNLPLLIGGALAAIVFLIFRKPIANAIIDLSMSKYRWISVLLLVLPLGQVYNAIMYVRNKYVFWTKSAPKKHDERVRRLQEQIRARDPNAPMCTARPNWQTTSIFHPSYKKSYFRADLSGFVDILEVDEKRGVVRCEPLVTCGQLTACLGPLGWTTAIIPELDDLTVGGLIAGFGVEGSSHKYGLFQHICVSYEVVLPNGDLIKCSATEHPELFYTIPWSYGTLGFLVAAEIKIVPARKYIHLKYEPCYSKEQYVELVTKYAREKKVDFIEALVYSKETAVVMTGYMTDHPESHKINSISRFYKPWFYQHVRDFLKFGPGDEYIPSSDYYHRHTKSLFWEMADILSFGNHPVFRYLLGWLIPPKVSFLKLFTVQRVHEQFKNHHVDQDMLVPIKDLSTCIDVFHQDWEIYPLWVCPCAIPKTPIRGLINPRADEEMFVDVGAYGVPKAPGYQAELRHRSVEKWVRDVKGFQALYAATYQTQQELETMFDHSVYYKLRKQYGCEGSMPVIYDKVGRHVRGL